MASAGISGQPRVILWSVPRSCTTAVLRSVSNIEGGAVYYEPFCSAFCYGPERDPMASIPKLLQHKDMYGLNAGKVYDSSVNTFAWVRQTLEAEHQDASLVFAKDFPYSLQGKWEHLPKGYYHSFLIRNPNKVIPSWRKVNMEEYRLPGQAKDEQAMEEWNDAQMGKHAGYKELWDLYEYVKENIDPSPFVMDADDLIANPEALMAAFCEATGMPYSKKLIDWGNDGLPMTDKWIICREQLYFMQTNYHKNARTSRGFFRNNELATKPSTYDMTNPKVQERIEHCLPYYQKLYQQRFIC